MIIAAILVMTMALNGTEASHGYFSDQNHYSPSYYRAPNAPDPNYYGQQQRNQPVSWQQNPMQSPFPQVPNFNNWQSRPIPPPPPLRQQQQQQGGSSQLSVGVEAIAKEARPQVGAQPRKQEDEVLLSSASIKAVKRYDKWLKQKLAAVGEFKHRLQGLLRPKIARGKRKQRQPVIVIVNQQPPPQQAAQKPQKKLKHRDQQITVIVPPNNRKDGNEGSAADVAKAAVRSLNASQDLGGKVFTVNVGAQASN